MARVSPPWAGGTRGAASAGPRSRSGVGAGVGAGAWCARYGRAMSSRQDRRRRAREEREAAERLAVAAASRRRRAVLAGGVAAALAVVGVVAAVLLPSGDSGSRTAEVRAAAIPPPRTTDLDTAVRLASARRISHPYAVGINDHTDAPVAYPTNPPTNGPHAFAWTEDGQYAGQPAPPTGEVVHAQEHGRIVIQYRPGLPRPQLEQLVGLYEESPRHVLLVENATRMPCDVAATAWGHGVLCPTLNARSFDALRSFRDRFRDRGPETVL